MEGTDGNDMRLIDANALQLEPDPWGGMNGVLILGRNCGKMMATVQAALRRMIENAPTVDAVKVVHGKWEAYCGGLLKCTACGYEYSDYLECQNYCPNCGAKMDGGEENGNQTDSI